MTIWLSCIEHGSLHPRPAICLNRNRTLPKGFNLHVRTEEDFIEAGNTASAAIGGHAGKQEICGHAIGLALDTTPVRRGMVVLYYTLSMVPNWQHGMVSARHSRFVGPILLVFSAWFLGITCQTWQQ